MGKSCSYHGCVSRWKSSKVESPEGNIRFWPFPKPRTKLAKCRRWIQACRLPDDWSHFQRKINKNVYICQKHFLDGKGPTSENPDPEPIAQFQLYPGSQHLGHILAPVGWAQERLHDGSCVLSKKRGHAAILQCTIKRDFEYELTILDTPAPYSILDTLPTIETIKDVTTFLNALEHLKICLGNPEPRIVNQFLKVKNPITARMCPASGTVFSANCTLIAKHRRCEQCVNYRANMKSRERQDKIRNQKNDRLQNLTQKHLTSKVKLFEVEEKLLKRKIAKAVNPGGKISAKENGFKSLHSQLQQSRFQKLLWKKKLKWRDLKTKQRKFKNKQATNLSVYSESSLCNSHPSTSVIALFPNQNLNDLKSGFQTEVIREMVEKSNLENLQNHQKYYCMVIDILDIPEDLAYHFKNDTASESLSEESPAKHIVQFWIRGITSNFEFLAAQFFMTDMSREDLLGMTWEGLELLEASGLRILGILVDQDTSNLKFFELFAQSYQNENTNVHHCTKNIFALDGDRDIYFFVDAAELFRTARDCLATSGIKRNARKRYSRLMWKNGEYLKWSTIVDCYKKDLKSPVRLLSELRYHHLHLKPHVKTNVKFAAQVLSHSMTAAVEHYHSGAYPETVSLLRTFRKFYDCLNVRQCSQDTLETNSDSMPYMELDDSRLQWLSSELVDYLNSWEFDVFTREGPFTRKERVKMFLNGNLANGLKVTALSTVMVIKFLLNLEERPVHILTSRLTKNPSDIDEPIENYNSSL